MALEFDMTDKKVWLKSKTIWSSVVFSAVIAAESNMHLLKPVLGDNVYLILCFAFSILVVTLRGITDKPVRRMKKKVIKDES